MSSKQLNLIGKIIYNKLRYLLYYYLDYHLLWVFISNIITSLGSENGDKERAQILSKFGAKQIKIKI